MIRFVDLRGQDTGYRFAFFDTVYDRFVTLGADQAWTSKADLIEGSPAGSAMLDRCLGLCPDWTNSDDENTDDMEDVLERADLP